MFRKQYINFKEIDYIKKILFILLGIGVPDSKKDNKTGNQTIANYTGAKLEDRTKAIVAKEATEDTLASIRNNPNVITGEEGRLLAESIPMDRREYVKWGRVFRGTAITFLGGFRT